MPLSGGSRQQLRSWLAVEQLPRAGRTSAIVFHDIPFLIYIAAAGEDTVSAFLCNRKELGSFNMAARIVTADTTTWLTAVALSYIVHRYSDLRGVGIPGNILLLLQGIRFELTPRRSGYVLHAIFPTLTSLSLPSEAWLLGSLQS